MQMPLASGSPALSASAAGACFKMGVPTEHALCLDDDHGLAAIGIALATFGFVAAFASIDPANLAIKRRLVSLNISFGSCVQKALAAIEIVRHQVVNLGRDRY